MPGCFIDTNVIVYANDRNAGAKQDRALVVIKRLMETGAGVISIQVLQEYARTALDKLHQESNIVLRQLKLLESLRIVPPTPGIVRRGVELCSAYRITFWDAAIVAAAEAENCDLILSEGFNESQFYAGVQVVNPFGDTFDLSFLDPGPN